MSSHFVENIREITYGNKLKYDITIFPTNCFTDHVIAIALFFFFLKIRLAIQMEQNLPWDRFYI